MEMAQVQQARPIRKARPKARCARLSGIALALACLVAFPFQAAAQSYPTKPIRGIIPYTPGGVAEAGPRLYAEKMGALLGQSIVIEFRPGGSGMVGITDILNAPADGYTLLMADSSHWAILPALQPVSYDFLRDFAPVSRMYTNSLIFVTQANAPYSTLRDLIAQAKAKPGTLNYASPGVGSPHHLLIEALKAGLNADIRHIPYKGGGEMVAALLRGDVALTVISYTAVMPQVKAGKMKMLAVSRVKRMDLVPEVGTVAELTGLADYDFGGVQAIVARAGTPRPIIERLSALAVQVGTQPDFVAKLREIGGSDAAPTTPEQLAEVIRGEIKSYANAVKVSGAKAQ